jgi:hypothetical protein
MLPILDAEERFEGFENLMPIGNGWPSSLRSKNKAASVICNLPRPCAS